MIWVDGEIRPDDGLAVSVLDRTFEHGLGLFETLRTWGGRPTLLDAHKARMLRSAAELGLPIDPATWPDAAAVARLLEAEGLGGDRMIRITATGGTASGRSVVWMRSAPLPSPPDEGGASLLLGAWKVAEDDTLARHKTLNYWSRRRASDEARRRGFDEALSGSSHDYHDFYHEGSRSNLFRVLDWRFGIGPMGIGRPTLVTTSEAGLIVPGIMRRLVLEVARELPLEVVEEVEGLDAEWLDNRGEVFLTNSVRGIIPVRRAVLAESGFEYTWPAPGRWTLKLQGLVARRLGFDRGGDSPS